MTKLRMKVNDEKVLQSLYNKYKESDEYLEKTWFIELNSLCRLCNLQEELVKKICDTRLKNYEFVTVFYPHIIPNLMTGQVERIGDWKVRITEKGIDYLEGRANKNR